MTVGECGAFLAVSYSAACTLSPKGTYLGYREALELMVKEFERFGERMYLAPREEQWGEERLERSVGIMRDFVALRVAADFLFFLDGRESDGALVELGAAVALRKRVWLLRRPGQDLPSYVTGLVEIPEVRLRIVSTRGDFVALVMEILGARSANMHLEGQQ